MDIKLYKPNLLSTRVIFLCISAVFLVILIPASTTASPQGIESLPNCSPDIIKHISSTYGIPTDQLLTGTYFWVEGDAWFSNGEEAWEEFPRTGKKACVTSVMEKVTGATYYDIAVDEGGQVVDLEKLRADERVANINACDKYDKALCAKLPAMGDQEQVEIAVWMKEIDWQSLLATVAAGYSTGLMPEAGFRFNPDHPDAQRATDELKPLVREAYLQNAKSVVDYLQASGIDTLYASTTSPNVFAIIKKPIIIDLSKREDVVGIYLLGGEFRDRLNSLVFTDRVRPFYDAGYTGSGINVAIVEDDPVNFEHQFLSHANGGTCDPYPYEWDDMEHPTSVAGIIAMKGLADYHGVSPDLSLISGDSGSYAPQERIAEATDCVIEYPYYARVLNLSFSNSNPPYDFWTRYFDHVVFHNTVTTVVAADEYGDDNVGNPDSGYNVLTVGGFDDNDNGNWIDDRWSTFSDYMGPPNRNKPEVVAVAEHICTTTVWDLNCGTTGPIAGTSYAAPQVSALAALLMEKTGITNWPELMRAIIMASAIHNIEGAPRLSDKDGVGGIDAGLAYKIADEGWFYTDTLYIYRFDPNGDVHYSVPLSRGQKVRAVFAYDSHPDDTDPYNNDALKSNLNLLVYNPQNSLVASSTSYYDSYEIVEFYTYTTGIYDFRVHKSTWNADYEYVSLAWAKDATYLPDVRSGYNSWESIITTENIGSEPREVKIQLFNANGTPNGSAALMNINPGAVWEYDPSVTNFSGTALMNGSDDLSVVIVNKASNGTKADAYSGVATAQNSNGYVSAKTVYVPVYFNNYYGWNTYLYILNTGASSTQVSAKFYNNDGVLVQDYQLPINPGARSVVTLSRVNFGSVRVESATEPLVVTIRHEHSEMSLTYEAASNGGTSNYIPTLFKDYHGWISSYQIQEITGQSVVVTVDYSTGYSRDVTINGYGHAEIYMASENFTCYPCSAVLTVTSGSGKIVTAVHHSNDSEHGTLGYHGFNSGDKDLLIPSAKKNVGGWDASITVQNVGSLPTDIHIYYYDQAGNTYGDPHGIYGLYPGQSIEVYDLPYGLNGSAWINSTDSEVVAVVHQAYRNGSDTRHYGYSVP